MIDIRVRRDECLALRKRKVNLTNQFNDLIDGIVVSNIDQNPFVFVKHKVNVATDHMTGLHV